MLNGKHLAEFLWAIELCVCYQRWRLLKELGLEPKHPREAVLARAMWVRTCMRLGESAARHIIDAQHRRFPNGNSTSNRRTK